MKKIFYFLSVMLILSSCNQGVATKDTGDDNSQLSVPDKQAILDTFMATKDAWNNGDLEGFMNGYWNSGKLLFVGSRGPTYGYDATLENYRKAFPNVEAMGHLDFEVIDLYGIDTKTAFMIGKFILTYDAGDIRTGYYTLVWQHIGDGWVIISDHSSPAAETE